MVDLPYATARRQIESRASARSGAIVPRVASSPAGAIGIREISRFPPHADGARDAIHEERSAARRLARSDASPARAPFSLASCVGSAPSIASAAPANAPAALDLSAPMTVGPTTLDRQHARVALAAPARRPDGHGLGARRLHQHTRLDASPRSIRWVERDGIGGVSMSLGTPIEVAAKLNDLQRRARVPLLVSSDLEPALGRLEGGLFAHYMLDAGGATVFPTAMAHRRDGARLRRVRRRARDRARKGARSAFTSTSRRSSTSTTIRRIRSSTRARSAKIRSASRDCRRCSFAARRTAASWRRRSIFPGTATPTSTRMSGCRSSARIARDSTRSSSCRSARRSPPARRS